MMTDSRKAFRLRNLENEEQDLINEINDYDNQLQLEHDDTKRQSLRAALERARLKLEINGLNLKIHGYEIEPENAITEEEKRRKEEQIKTKEILLHDANQRLLSQTQGIQPGNNLFSQTSHLSRDLDTLRSLFFPLSLSLSLFISFFLYSF